MEISSTKCQRNNNRKFKKENRLSKGVHKREQNNPNEYNRNMAKQHNKR